MHLDSDSPMPPIDCRALRRRLGLTQAQFSIAFGISIGTLRNWEQRRSSPDAAACVLLHLISARPDLVFASVHTLPLAEHSAEENDESTRFTVSA